MKSGRAGDFVREMDILFRTGAVGGLTDRELLEVFTDGADSVSRRAFEAIVGRHGAMVLGVCRRVVRDEHTAEDAFQATFLALALKAGTIRNRDSLGAWLYGVAARISRRARDVSRRRAGHSPAHARLDSRSDSEIDAEAIELRSVLDEEVDRLPRAYRIAVVLCYLEGKTQEDAARELGWSKGTVSGRLARAKDLLRARLTHRGFAPSAGLVAMVLAPTEGSAAVPAALVTSTARAAFGLALGRPETLVASRSVMALAEGALRGMLLTRVAVGAVGVLLCVAIATALAQTATPPGSRGQADRPQNRDAGRLRHENANVLEPKLPQHARARLGTTRLRHSRWVTSITFAPDDRIVTSAGADGAVRFWDLATGEPAAKFPAIKESGAFREVIAQSVAYSPDGSLLAIGRQSGLVQVWDLAAGKERMRFQAHKECVWGIAFAPDGLSFATASDQDPLVRIWEAATGREKRTFERDGGPIFYPSLAFSPDGKSLALGASARDAENNSIYVWASDGASSPNIIRDVHRGRLVNLAFAPGGWVVSCGWGARRVRDPQGNQPDDLSIPQIRVWDAVSGRKLADLDPGTVEGISGLVLARDGKTLVSAHHDQLLVWNLPSGTISRTIAIDAERTPAKRCPGIAISPDGKTVAVDRGDETVRLWDLSTGKPLFHNDNAHDALVRSVAIAPDGRLAATGDDNGVVRVWDIGRAEVVRRHELGCRVWAVRFAPDGQTLAAAGHDSDGVHGVVRLWAVGDFSLRRELRLGLPGVLLEFGPDGRKLAVASDVIGVFDLATGKKEVELPGHDGEIRGIALAHDNKTLVSAGQGMNGQDTKFRFWDLATSRLTREIPIEGHRGGSEPRPTAPESLGFAVFASDLGTAVTSGFGDQLLAWGLSAGRPMRTFRLETYAVASLALSPDGRLLAAAVTPVSTDPARSPSPLADASIRIWELATKREVLRLEPGTTECWALAFSADGRTLVSGATDTTAIVWDCRAAYDALKPPANR